MRCLNQQHSGPPVFTRWRCVEWVRVWSTYRVMVQLQQLHVACWYQRVTHRQPVHLQRLLQWQAEADWLTDDRKQATSKTTTKQNERRHASHEGHTHSNWQHGRPTWPPPQTLDQYGLITAFTNCQNYQFQGAIQTIPNQSFSHYGWLFFSKFNKH